MMGNVAAWGDVTDVLTRASLGLKNSGNTYENFTKIINNTTYTGKASPGGGSRIQLNSTNPYGIVTTASSGKVKTIIIDWNTGTSSERIIDVYGKTTAYSGSSDLYDTSKRGTLIGSIQYGTTELDISGDYSYIGLRTRSGAIYLDEIDIVWEEIQSYTITPQSNNDSWGTVALNGNVITASPAEGYRVSTTDSYTVTSGSATVTQNGNVFTVNATSDCTVRINFEKIPVVTAVSNNDSWGTVSLSGNVITATPADGYHISTTTPYEVTNGTATVTQDGNEFTVNATSDCTVQINFEASPVNIYIKSDSAPHVYTWTSSGGVDTKYTGDWPGNTVTSTTEIGGITWYYVSVPARGFNLILNNGDSGNDNQTADITNITHDVYYVWNSAEDNKSGANQYQEVSVGEMSATNLQLNVNATGNSTITTTPTGLSSFIYSSSNESVATVAANNGTVTGRGEGQAVITVYCPAQEVNSKYYVAKTTFTVTVTEAPRERTYAKVTSTDEIEDGKKYLIVYENGGVAFDGSRETLDASGNIMSVTINDNKITTDENIYFKINNTAGTILSASGRYIGRTSDSNGLNESTSTAYTNTISISNGNVSIIGSGGASLKFNDASNQNRFRYYASGQKDIQLYKEIANEVTIYVKSDVAPYVYTWTGDVASATKYTGDWPGTQTTQTEEVNGVTWHKIIVPAKGFNLILNDGNSGEGHQTANIENITEDTYFVWNSEDDGYDGGSYLKVMFAEVTAEDLTLRVSKTGNTLTKSPEGLELTCTSSNENIATVANDGTVTGVSEGTATIIVNWATQTVGNQGYVSGSLTFSVTVTPAPQGWVFVKATSVDELQDGMQVIIVNEEYNNVMGVQSTSNYGVENVEIDKTFSPYEAIPGENATILTLETKTENENVYWYFRDEHDKYLYTSSNSSNELKTKDEQDNFAKASISISGDNSDAEILFQGVNDRNQLMYNGSSHGNGYFSCYAHNQKAVQIYYRASQNIVARPTIAPTTGTYNELQTVTITNNAEGATVYYTTDGTTPTAESTAYSSPFTLSKNGTYTIKAIASADGQSSAVTTSVITIDITVQAPVITPADGTQITEETTVSITAAEGTTIYYTIDGTAPVVDGEVTGTAKAYTGTFNLTKASTVKAVAKDAYGNFSEISTATYTYNGTATLPYYERFDAGLGNFISVNTGNVEWNFRKHEATPEFLAKYGEERKYAYAGGSQSQMANISGKARLVSPIFDLTEEGLTHVMFNFIHAGKGFTASNLTNTCKVQIITDDNERDITLTSVLSTDANWTDLTVPTWFNYSGNTFPRTNSGDIDLSGYVGKKVRVCFLYDATSSSNYGTWNVDQVSLRGELVEKVTISQPNGATGEGYTTYVLKNDINVATTLSEKGVKMYKVVEFDKNNVVIVQLGSGEGTMGENTYSETVAPAGSPVLLKGEFGERELVLLTSQEVVPKLRGNLLRSTADGEVTATENDRLFVLQFPQAVGAYGFHLLKTGKKISGRKAYLNGVDEVEELTIQTNAKKGIFLFGDEDMPVATDITRTESEKAFATDAVYDLMGRKVVVNTSFHQLPKGIYIVNGKKFVVK